MGLGPVWDREESGVGGGGGKSLTDDTSVVCVRVLFAPEEEGMSSCIFTRLRPPDGARVLPDTQGGSHVFPPPPDGARVLSDTQGRSRVFSPSLDGPRVLSMSLDGARVPFPTDKSVRLSHQTDPSLPRRSPPDGVPGPDPGSQPGSHTPQTPLHCPEDVRPTWRGRSDVDTNQQIW